MASVRAPLEAIKTMLPVGTPVPDAGATVPLTVIDCPCVIPLVCESCIVVVELRNVMLDQRVASSRLADPR